MSEYTRGSPAGLVPKGALAEPLEQFIDPEEFTPRLLALLSNALVWRESRQLRRRFALGTNEWRVIASLAARPGLSATEVSEFLAMNKAIVSKSVNILAERELIALSDGPRGSRPMYLTPAGAEMHDRMLPISIRGQEIILKGLLPKDVRQFNALLRRMLATLKELETTESEESILAAG